ncbi:MAG: DUF1097 domain-containing protein [Halobacteriales archaeon]|nr:DUF1097 domain-containing protein [Halobacteriales archaeon]
MTQRPERTAVLTLAAVFGLASVPWTYGFIAGLELPLWPSFVAAASFYAAGGGLDGLRRSAAGNLVGVLYAAATVGLVEGALGGGVLALSLAVGGFMFLASLHPLVEPLSFAPAGFLGYASLFGVHAAGSGAVLGGLAGEAVAAASALLLGALIGFATELSSDRLTRTEAAPS